MGSKNYISIKGLTEARELETAIDSAVERGGDPEILRTAQNMVRSGTHFTRGAVRMILLMVGQSLENKPRCMRSCQEE